MLVLMNHETRINSIIIDYCPFVISPETSFVDVLKKLLMGHDFLIVANNSFPLGYISPHIIIKIVAENINLYSLRAKNFCQSFPYISIDNLPDVFTIANNLYLNKYQLYGCLNEQGF